MKDDPKGSVEKGGSGNGELDEKTLLQFSLALKKGDFSARLPIELTGLQGKVADTFNDVAEMVGTLTTEVNRICKVVGKEGRMEERINLKETGGSWGIISSSVNTLIDDLGKPMKEISRVLEAVANGDLSQTIALEIEATPVKGEFLRVAETVNTLVDKLNTFASEVTRVAKEVGTEGKLGSQAEVQGVSGVWKDLTDSVNLMANDLTEQVRGIVKVVTAIAEGDLEQKYSLAAKGEIASLADTINDMTKTLATFADQVIGVAKEVGVEGRLGGQAEVPGASGTWKDLVNNVNMLANNLTTQVRAIAEVATAVTKGDLSREVTVEAKGEVNELKEDINTMITNLRTTTQQNEEQDWLKTNLAKLTGMLQGQNDLNAVAQMLMSELAPVVNVQHGVFYLMETDENEHESLKLLASYAYKEHKNLATHFEIGEGVVGQCAFEKQKILLTNVPNDYIQITSGLGKSTPLNLIVLPVVFEGDVKAVIELASFNLFSQTNQMFLEQLTDTLGVVLNTIEANLRTEDLLAQSQLMSEELQSQSEELQQTNEELESQSEELQQTNEELEEKAKMLEEQKREVEAKNQEVEQAKQAVEKKAEQLAITSKYKSQFLSSMSHELRTPLNSLLLLSKQLADNPEGNLNEKQVEFAYTIQESGNDLLTLLNDILDLSKIESGTVTGEIGDVVLADLKDEMARRFKPSADSKKLGFSVKLDDKLPPVIRTDGKLLRQVLKNLLSNSMKFTETGRIDLEIAQVTKGWGIDNEVLDRADTVVAFSVKDTGIGIAKDKQKVVFEAFQQADGSTTRKYGGTGLGLSISRQIAQLLGGELGLTSTIGKGSTFAFYLPQDYSRALSKKPSHPEYLANASDQVDIAITEPAAIPENVRLPDEIIDDRYTIDHGDGVVLIVDDDTKFVKILLNMAHKKGFKALVALDGNSGLAMAREFMPSAITLDMRLRNMDGWSLLDRLKLDPKTRHIPVHIITVENQVARGLRQGAMAYITKPVSADALSGAFDSINEYIEGSVRNLLVIEPDEAEQEGIIELIGNGDVLVDAVASGGEALSAMEGKQYDCVVLDLGLPDMTGFEFLAKMRERPDLRYVPVVVYTGTDLNEKQQAQIEKLAKTIIIKGVKSPERLLDETTLFLHRVASELPLPKQKILDDIYMKDTDLRGKTVLIVDDDTRNIFALASVLERHGINVESTDSGESAIKMLEEDDSIDAVLMDVMMPEMDGYEAMKKIRKLPKFKSLPIVALTAKAMKGDRDKCISAGASDYIEKPVDIDQLLSLLRVWTYK